jgi:hypothetical protein
MHSGGDQSVFVPEKHPAERWIALGIFVVCCLYLRLFYDYTILNADEGIVLQGAQRILEGQVLYRDFFSFYTPGSYYWMAFLFKVFGSSILVGRGVLVAYGGVFAVLTYLVARRVCSRWSALVASYLVIVTCLPFRFLVLHNWDSTLSAYLALYLALLFVERGHWIWALGSGSFASFTVLCEQSKGVGLVFGLAAGFLLIGWSKHSRALFRGPQIVGLALGTAWPIVVTLIYFTSKHSLSQMLSAWTWPVFHYSVANKLPYGYLIMSTSNRNILTSGDWVTAVVFSLVLVPSWVLSALPLLAVGIWVWLQVKRPRSEAFGRRWSYGILISSTLVGFLLAVLITRRPDFTHLNYLSPFFYLIVAWIIGGFGPFLRLLGSLRQVIAVLLVIAFTCSGVAFLWTPLSAHRRVNTPRGIIRTAEPDKVLEYIQSHASPGEKIFVYPYEPLYYYLTATSSPSRFDFLQPGMHTPDQFREAARELAADPPRVLLFETTFQQKIALAWPSTPSQTLKARDPVEDYVLGHYRPCSTLVANGFWHFVAMVPKEGTCPPGEAGGVPKP